MILFYFLNLVNVIIFLLIWANLHITSTAKAVRDFGSTSWGKPEHVHGIEFAWGIVDSRPGQISELPHLETATANPITLKFEDEERGKKIYYAARWLNNTAQPGLWSDIESAFVP